MRTIIILPTTNTMHKAISVLLRDSVPYVADFAARTLTITIPLENILPVTVYDLLLLNCDIARRH